MSKTKTPSLFLVCLNLCSMNPHAFYRIHHLPSTFSWSHILLNGVSSNKRSFTSCTRDVRSIACREYSTIGYFSIQIAIPNYLFLWTLQKITSSILEPVFGKCSLQNNKLKEPPPSILTWRASKMKRFGLWSCIGIIPTDHTLNQ